mgnify:CR=1 FL=1
MEYQSLRDVVLATIKSYCSYWGEEQPQNLENLSDQELLDFCNKKMYSLW